MSVYRDNALQDVAELQQALHGLLQRLQSWRTRRRCNAETLERIRAQIGAWLDPEARWLGFRCPVNGLVVSDGKALLIERGQRELLPDRPPVLLLGPSDIRCVSVERDQRKIKIVHAYVETFGEHSRTVEDTEEIVVPPETRFVDVVQLIEKIAAAG